ncbi:MAG: YbbR-like domain-containing protein [Candidatus Eisenbacteria bacterium]|nr:YbbR-like domain-containing protein [Candidatus Eisenbacteria bacterium]
MNVLRGWLFDNLGLKFTALLLAVVVYLNVYTDREQTMLVSFPVEFTDLADTLSLSGPTPAVVQAELHATGKQLIGLRVKEPRLKLSLLGIGVGRFSRALAPTDLPLPSAGVTVENLIGPRVIEVDLDRKVHRDIPVAVQTAGAPANGYVWQGASVLRPALLRVTGPEAVLAKLDSIPLATIRLDGKRDTVRAEVAPASLPDWCTVEPATVLVKLVLARRTP